MHLLILFNILCVCYTVLSPRLYVCLSNLHKKHLGPFNLELDAFVAGSKKRRHPGQQHIRNHPDAPAVTSLKNDGRSHGRMLQGNVRTDGTDSRLVRKERDRTERKRKKKAISKGK